MTCRIERSQAAGFKQQLLIYIEELRAGRGADIQTIRHEVNQLPDHLSHLSYIIP